MPKTLATATVDRLLHHAHVVLTEGASYRLAEATAEPTPNGETPAPPTAAPEATVNVVREVIIPWQSSGVYVEWDDIVEIKNNGTGWAEIGASSSDYTIFAKNGDVLDTGSFTYALPRYLAPDRRGTSPITRSPATSNSRRSVASRRTATTIRSTKPTSSC
jgi:hypothetical protein